MEEVAEKLSRLFVVVFTPLLLCACAILGWRWRCWIKKRSG